MKWTSKQSYLGIAVGERTITAAEIARGGAGGAAGGADGGWEVRAAEFVMPTPVAGAGDDATAHVEQLLGKFLRDNGFSSARAVVGVPARWLVAKEREVPPSGPEQAAEVLRMQAERLFSAELGEVVVDYAGTSDTSAPRGVLLVAMPKRQLERVVRMVESTGRDVAAVMPSTLALAGTSSSPADGLVLNVSEDAVELAAHRGGAPRLLRHLVIRGPELTSQNGTRAAALSSLAGEIRRTVALMPRGGTDAAPTTGSSGTSPTLDLWDGIGLDAQDAGSLAKQSGVDLRPGAAARGLSAFGLSKTGHVALATARATTSAANTADALARFAPAVALALAGASRRVGAVDFLHPRLAAPKKRRFGKFATYAIAIAAALVLGVLLFWAEVEYRSSSLAKIEARITEMKPQFDAAEAASQRIGVARGWYAEGRPAVLECLREITVAFPDGAEAMYITKLTLLESRQGNITGKAPNEAMVFDLVSRLNQNKSFANVTADVSAVDATRRSTEIAFKIEFAYPGPSGAAATAAVAPAPAPAPTTTRSR